MENHHQGVSRKTNWAFFRRNADFSFFFALRNSFLFLTLVRLSHRTTKKLSRDIRMLIITNGLKCVTNSKRSLKTLKNIFLSLSLPRDFLHVRRSRISNCSLKTDCISFFPSISGSSVRVTQFFKHSFSQETIGAKKRKTVFCAPSFSKYRAQKMSYKS